MALAGHLQEEGDDGLAPRVVLELLPVVPGAVVNAACVPAGAEVTCACRGPTWSSGRLRPGQTDRRADTGGRQSQGSGVRGQEDVMVIFHGVMLSERVTLAKTSLCSTQCYSY